MKTLSTFEDWISNAKETEVTFNDDPFALTSASYRCWREGQPRFLELNSVSVTPEDRVTGNDMRRYYRGRLVFDQLKNTTGNTISSFRQKLWNLCEGTGSITQKDMGLLYKLPYFYAEDLAHDSIFMNLPDYKVLPQPASDITATFKLTHDIWISRSGRDNHQYWLRSEGTPVPCMIAAQHDNPMRPLLESILLKDTVTLKANWHPQNMRGYHRGRWFYHLGNVQLV